MFDWYHGFDVSYADGGKYHKRRFMLPDQGRSGIVMVKKPDRLTSLPGFAEFSDSLNGVSSKIYVQTNDGVLHVTDPVTMREDMGILPPPALLPRRIFSLKAIAGSNGYKWIDPGEYPAGAGSEGAITSSPSYVLDGPLQLRHFNLGANSPGEFDWRAMLFGTMGRGGSGIYAMEVTDPSFPKFSWYRETIENEDGSVTLVWRGKGTPAPDGSPHPAAPYTERIDRDNAYWDDIFKTPGAHAYEQLGFNSPKPYFSVVRVKDEIRGDDHKYQNLIALAGGMQNRLNLNDNGKMGAVLYLIDPDAKFHGEKNPGGVWVFNSGSLKKTAPEWRTGSGTTGRDPHMGMMTSEPVFLSSRHSKYMASGVFVADNRGSVFYVNFEDMDGLPLTPDRWKIRTVASLRAKGDGLSDNYSIPSGVIGGSSVGRPGSLWLAGGTADVVRRDPVPGDDTSMRLVNKSQMIFAFLMPDLTSGRMTSRETWSVLDPDQGRSGIKDNAEGWYIPLRTAGKHQYGAEYVTARPVFYGRNMYVATFREHLMNINSGGACPSGTLMGDSRLYVLSLETGESALWGDGDSKYLDFEGVRISGFTLSEKGNVSTLIVSYQVLDKDAAKNSLNNNIMNERDNLSKADGMDALVIKMPDTDESIPLVTSNDAVVNYWRVWKPTQ
jgi:hypothetical protein